MTRKIAMMQFVAVCLLVLTAVFLPSVAFAQEDTAVSDDDVNRVASQLFCPTCEAIPVDVCPTEVCTDWRNEIRAQLAEGKSDDEILDYFAIRYGGGVLANPPAEGFGLFIWIAPAVVLLLAGGMFARYMRQLQTATASSETQLIPQQKEPVPSGDQYRARLENELKE